MAKEVEFWSWQEQEFSLLQVDQTGTGAHQASYPVDKTGSFPEVKMTKT
jgi:hypothetical protein